MTSYTPEAVQLMEALLRAYAKPEPLMFETKFASNGDVLVTGYGAVFNNFDSHKDYIEPGSFTLTLNEHKARGTKPKMYAMHDYDAGEIGAWQHVSEDKFGLVVKGRIASNEPQGKATIERIERKELGGLSIGYRAVKFRRPPGYNDVRFLEVIALGEVSIVDRPSNSKALIHEVTAHKSPADEDSGKRLLELMLADAKQAVAPPARERAPFLVPAAGYEIREHSVPFRR